MKGMAVSTKVLIFESIFIFAVHLTLSNLAGRGGNELFPTSISNVSRIYRLEITPAGATFAIWGVIYLLELTLLIYCLSTVLRSGRSTNILSNKFYVCYMMEVISNTVWFFYWSRQFLVGSLVTLVAGQFFITATVYFACRDLYDYLVDSGFKVNADVWCVRLLAQNGILFYGTWTLIALLLNVAIVISYTLGYPTLTGSLISLFLLGAIAIVWFVLENFVFKAYCQFTFSAYIVLIIGLGGILARSRGQYVLVARITMALLLLSGVFLVARILIIAVRARRKSTIKD